MNTPNPNEVATDATTLPQSELPVAESAENNVHTDIATAPEVTSPLAGPGVITPTVTDEEIIGYLIANDPLIFKFKEKIDAMLHDLRFLQDNDWIKHATDGFEVTDHAERLEKQLTKTVTKTLRNEAFDVATATGKAPVDPSLEMINAEVQKKIAERLKKLQQAKDLKISKATAAIIASR